MSRPIGRIGLVLAAMSLMAGQAAAQGSAAPVQAPPPVTQLVSPDTDALSRVGYDTFRVDVRTLTPGPIDDGYRLAPGDEVNLRVWGQLQLMYRLTVTADLALEVPDVPGRVYVAGLGLRDITDRLRRHLATAYAIFFNMENPAASTAFVDVALGKVRDVRFLVQGEVAVPGSYALHPSLANVVYALAAAGGVTGSGSLREVRVRRGGQLLSLDFFDFVLRGEMDLDRLRLQDGDVVFVPLVRREVSLRGEVRRPGRYTLHGSAPETLDKVIEFAGGVLPTANTTRILIRRTTVNVGQQTLSIDLEAMRKAGTAVPLADGDVITILRTSDTRTDFVQLRGAGTLVPGEYQYVKGMRLSDLIAAAGGLASDAYLPRADLRRTGADSRDVLFIVDLRRVLARDPEHDRDVQPLDVLHVQTIDQIEGAEGSVTLQGYAKEPGRVGLTVGMRLSDLLFGRAGLQDPAFSRNTYLPRAEIARVSNGSAGREIIAIDLRRLLAGDSAADPVLSNDDIVTVFDRRVIAVGDRTVTLSGHAKRPGRHPLADGMRVSDLLLTVGGYADPVFVRDAYLARGDILRVVSRETSVERELVRFDLGALLRGDLTQNPLLQADDEVRVYKAADFSEPARVEIAGAVHKPSEHPLAVNMTLEDLLLMGGGLRDLADPETADLFRTTVGPDGRVAIEHSEISLREKGLALRHRDRILIRVRAGYQPARQVEIGGLVQSPGRYSVPATARIADLVRLAGGLAEGAFREGAEFRRGGPNGTRIVFDLARALERPEAPDNLVLQEGDVLTIPGVSTTVVVTDGTASLVMAWVAGKGVDYYVAAVGGLPRGVSMSDVRVRQPNGRYAAGRFLRGPEVRPGSTIEVPHPEQPSATTTSTAVQGPAPAQAPAAAGAARPAPRGESDMPAGETFDLTVASVAGTCPVLTLTGGDLKVMMSDVTRFGDVSCSDLVPGVRLVVRAVRLSPAVLHAVEIRRKP